MAPKTMPATSAPALDALASDLLAGRVSLDAAREAARRMRLEDVPPRDATRWILDVEALSERLDRDDVPARVADLGRLLATAARAVSRNAEGRVLLRAGQRLFELESQSAALDFLTRAGELLADDPEGLALVAARWRLIDLYELGRFAEAEEAARRLAAAVGERRDLEAFARLVGANAASHLGEGESALREAAAAVALREALTPEEVARGVVPARSFFLEWEGLVARRAARYEAAVAAFEAARRAAEEEGDPTRAVYLASEVGITWQEAGDPERGAAVLAAAAVEAETLGLSRWAARWRRSETAAAPPGDEEEGPDKLARAQALVAQPARRAEARRLLVDCIREGRDRPHPELEAHARAGLAALHAANGDFFQAVAAGRAAVAAARRASLAGSALHYRTDLALYLSQQGFFREAEDELRRAVSRGEDLRRAARTAELRQTLGAGLARAYEQLALLVARHLMPDPGEVAGNPAPDLLEIGQRTRGVNLLRWLVLRERVEAGDDPRLLPAFLDLRAAEVAIEAASLGSRPLSDLFSRQEAAKRRFRERLEAAGLEPIDEALVFPPEEIAAALGSDEVFVDLLALEEGVTATLWTPAGGGAATIFRWRRPERLRLLADLELALRRAGRCLAERDGVAAALAAVERFAGEIDRRFTRPLAGFLAGRAGEARHLLVAVHRELSLLPLSRLSDPDGERRVSVLPSSGALPVLRRRGRDLEGPALALDDATGTLPGARAEVELLVRDHDFRLVRRWAEELPEARRLHFAGHGFFDRARPYASGLVVPREAAPERPDPWGLGYGVLAVEDLVGRHDLGRCGLAVLSACETGLPRLHPASESTGLPAALLIAGARNVVASLWRTQDAATRLLMERFYEALAAGRPPSAALAGARRWLARLPRAEASERAGGDAALPPGERPFASPLFTDAFQHLGVD